MAVKVTTYNGFHLGAAAIKVPAVDRFLSSVTIVKADSSELGHSKLYTARSSHCDGLFDTAAEAIEAAMALGEQVVNTEEAAAPSRL